jgi:monoamine oxidase
MLADTLVRGPHWAEELQYFTPHTMQGVAESIAAPILDRIRFGAPVTRIDWSEAGVIVTAAGQRLTARRVILSVSPIQVQAIAFHPALPDPLANAVSAFGRMAVAKILLRYERAFWADRGWSGSAGCTDPSGLFFADTSSPGRPMLVAFLGGPSCSRLHAMPPDDRRALILSRAAAAFGHEALTPLNYTERVWVDDEWSPGGYGVLVTGDRPTQATATLRDHSGVVSFAVSDISDRFPGYIEGGIHMGRRAAARTIAALQSVSA